MKRYCLALISLFLISCQTKAATGGIIGGIIGAGVGGWIDEGRGAIVGTVIGTAAGGVVGSIFDKERSELDEKKVIDKYEDLDQVKKDLSLSDIIRLSEEGYDDETIICMIQKRKTVYQLNIEEIRLLKYSGVSKKVINFMIDTRKCGQKI